MKKHEALANTASYAEEFECLGDEQLFGCWWYATEQKSKLQLWFIVR